MKNIVIFGAPGSGKGTQSDKMIEKYGLNHISTGDVLRGEIKNGTELGKTAASYIDKGQLIPDDLMVSILASVYDKFGRDSKGVIFDGFPRTIPQAEALKKMLDDNPWIECSSAFIGLSDTLYIKAKEYEPVLRIFNTQGRSVYVTEAGVIVPACPHYTPRMLIANGHFTFPVPTGNGRITDSLYANAGISEALAIAKAIRRDPFLTGTIGQIYRYNNEYELMVNDLQARVILGDTCHLDQRLARLRKLLENYSGTDELKPYKTLSLKYKNQIVCTKQ